MTGPKSATDRKLSATLAHRCQGDWLERFSPAERVDLNATVRRAFLDTAACILSGREEEPTRILLGWARRSAGVASSSVLFGSERMGAALAAMVNGAAGHALDFDDVALAGHPSVVLVPAILAESERLSSGGRDVLNAYAKGYGVWGELQRRLKVMLHPRGWHPTAVFGPIGAAAAVASLRGLDETRTGHALGIAASMASGVVANFGSMTKPLHIGRAARAGIEACDLAEAGLDSSSDALDGPSGLLCALAGGASGVDVDGQVPEGFEATAIRSPPGIKKYPVCYAAHRVVDGVLRLRSEGGFDAADVAGVEAAISETTAGVLRHHQPREVSEARFSIEFCVAAAIVYGRLGIGEVARAALSDPRVLALMPRVATTRLQTSCPLEPSFAFTDSVRVILRDGRVLESGPIRFAIGHAEMPIDEERLLDKLRACAGTGDEGLADRVIDRMIALVTP